MTVRLDSPLWLPALFPGFSVSPTLNPPQASKATEATLPRKVSTEASLSPDKRNLLSKTCQAKPPLPQGLSALVYGDFVSFSLSLSLPFSLSLFPSLPLSPTFLPKDSSRPYVPQSLETTSTGSEEPRHWFNRNELSTAWRSWDPLGVLRHSPR